MNSRKHLIGFLAFAVSVSVSWSQTTDERAVKANLVKVAETCCPDAKYILSKSDAAEMYHYMDGSKDPIVDIGNFGTAVHEALHGLDFEIGSSAEGFGTWPEGYFIEKGREVVVPDEQVFHTADLHASYFPAEVKRLFRYNTYILDVEKSNGPAPQSTVTKSRPLMPGESTTSANVSGIFGLLEEFNAYYHGMHAEYQLMKSGAKYKDDGGSNLETDSYFEFNVFMAYYLKYAKEKHPSTYKSLVSNTALREAYTLVETNWRDLLTRIYQDKEMSKVFLSGGDAQTLFNSELQAEMNGFMLPVSKLPKHASFFKSKLYNPQAIAENRKGYADNWSDLGWGEDGELDFMNLNGKKIGPKEAGYHYVVVNSFKNGAEALKLYMEVYSKYQATHIFKDGGMYHVYIQRHTRKADAISTCDRIRNVYPSIKVM